MSGGSSSGVWADGYSGNWRNQHKNLRHILREPTVEALEKRIKRMRGYKVISNPRIQEEFNGTRTLYTCLVEKISKE